MKATFLNQSLPFRVLLVPLLVSSLVLAGCDSDDDDDTATGDGVTTDGGDNTNPEPDGTDGTDGTDGSDTGADGDGSSSQVIITTVASDFSSSAIEIHNTTEPRDGVTGLNPGISDTIVRAFEDNYYVCLLYTSDAADE